MEAVSTKDNKPNVRAFQVFSAINAIAIGITAVALNFSPSRKGSTTFLMKPRPEIGEMNIYYVFYFSKM